MAKREVSENSWIVKVEDIVKRDYDLSAKNPHRKQATIYRSPKEIAKGVLNKEKKIEEILREVTRHLE